MLLVLMLIKKQIVLDLNFKQITIMYINFFYDCEFLEGKQDKTFLGIKYGETKPVIDLISIGITSQDSREYYAISKDFNLKEAWNRYDLKVNKDFNTTKEESHYNPMYIKEYWIRENVLKPIWEELSNAYLEEHLFPDEHYEFSYKSLKILIKKYGKTNKQIAKEIQDFVYKGCNWNYPNTENIKFYGYYSAYDHIVLCQLFGKMIDLPAGFPMYTTDLKQEIDRIFHPLRSDYRGAKDHPNYPKQTNEHSAICDAKWNKELYNFLKTVK